MEKKPTIVRSYKGLLDAMEQRRRNIGVTREFYYWLADNIKFEKEDLKAKTPTAYLYGMKIYIQED